MKPADLDIEFNKKSLKLRLIIMLKYKNIFSKVANQFTSSKPIGRSICINKAKDTTPWTSVTEDLNVAEELNGATGTFYEQELHEKFPYSKFFWTAFSRRDKER